MKMQPDSDIPVCASMRESEIKNRIEKMTTTTIPKNVWEKLKQKAIEKLPEDNTNEPFCTNIYTYVTQDYSLDDLEKAETVYDFEMTNEDYYIEKIPLI